MLRVLIVLMLACESQHGWTTEPPKTLVMRADKLCPYNCEPGGVYPGYLVEIAQAVFEPLGYSIDYQLVNWSRAMHLTRAGQSHAVVGAFKSDVPDFVFPELSQGIATNTIWVRAKSEFDFQDVSSFRDIRLGVVQGYSYGEEVDAYIQHNRRDDSRLQMLSGDTPLERNIQSLVLGRVDAIIVDKAVMQYHMQYQGIEYAIRAAGVLKQEQVYIAFSPAGAESSDLAEMLSQGMVSLRRSGQLEVILNRYAMQDWQ